MKFPFKSTPKIKEIISLKLKTGPGPVKKKKKSEPFWKSG